MSKRLTDYQRIELIEKYKTGQYNCQTLGDEYGVTRSSVHYLLKTRGVPINNDKSVVCRTYKLNQKYFDIIDTEEKAYFLGLLYADGWNYEDGGQVGIKLQARDVLILEKFRDSLDSNYKLHFSETNKKNKNHQNTYTLLINSQYMSKQLIKLGCVPAKSLILTFPTEEQVPFNLMQHFVRGYFDGDGCVRTTKRNQIYCCLISTLDFCEGVRHILKNKINVNSQIQQREFSRVKNSTTRTLELGGNLQGMRFLEWIYGKATVYLDRKYQTYIRIKNSISSK